MIYCLTGKLLEKAPDYAVVSCGGVGYLAAIPSTTAGALPAVGDTCTLYTCMNVTENDVSLFGFADKESQTMFRLLTGVSGVGPKAALAILSVGTPEHLTMAIITGDEKALTAAPGVGKKLAQRILLELKDKIAKETQEIGLPASADGAALGSGSKAAEAAAALAVLGYTQQDISAALKGVDVETLPLEEIVRQSLKKMVK